jgi:hypothetical protein
LSFDRKLATLWLAGFIPAGIGSTMQRLRLLALALASILVAPVVSAKKAPPVLEWRDGILWASPDPCLEYSGFNRQTFLIIGGDIVYHVSHNPIRHKPNVTEHAVVKYAMAEGDFYLQDEDGRVSKLSVVSKETIPDAHRRFANGEPTCQP